MTLKDRAVALGLVWCLTMLPSLEGTRLVPYRDPIGIWTDCTGHTGRDVVPGKKNSIAQCDEKLSADVLTAYTVVQSCVTVPLNDNQKSAYTSFAFNVGHGRKGVKDGFCVLKNGHPPAFLRKLNAGDYSGACYGILQWVNAAGRPLPGLVARRGTESKLCLKEPDVLPDQ